MRLRTTISSLLVLPALLAAGAARADTYTWIGPTSGTAGWTSSTNWTPFGVPTAPGDEAIFNVPYVSGQPPLTVNINSPVTIGRYVNQGTASPRLTGSGSITFRPAAGEDYNWIHLPGRDFNCDLPITLIGTLKVDAEGSSAYSRFGGPISGSGYGIQFLRSTQTQVLAGNNTYQGQTLIEQALVILEHVNGLGSTSSGTVVRDQGTLWLNVDGGTVQEPLALAGKLRNGPWSDATWAGPIELTDAAVRIENDTFTGQLRTFTISGPISGGSAGGQLEFYGDQESTTILSGSNSYLGQTRITSQVGSTSKFALQVGASGAIPDASRVVFGSYTKLALNDHDEAIGGLSGAYSTSEVALGSANLDIGYGNGFDFFDGIITGTGRVGKRGTGVQTFTGANTFTGTLEVTGGTLVNSGSLTGATAVSAGASVEGTGTYAALAVHDDGIFSPGPRNAVGAAISDSAVWGDAGTYRWDIAHVAGTAGVQWDLWRVTRSAGSTLETVGGGSLLKIVGDPTGFDNSQAYSWLIAETSDQAGLADFDPTDVSIDSSQFAPDLGGGQFALTVLENGVYLNFGNGEVPAPSALVGLVGLAAVGLAMALRRRRRAA